MYLYFFQQKWKNENTRTLSTYYGTNDDIMLLVLAIFMT